jgi:large subunit ribosomal protein L15
MSMPFRIRPMDKKNEWRCNDDPKKLNDFYNRMLGPGGESLLSEETKWLAVTHKSFDQGRRGFNDKMSYFGVYREIVPRWIING